MKKRIWNLGIVIAVFFCGIAQAQTPVGTSDAVSIPGITGFPSPTAASMVQTEQIPVDYYNGTASTSIPLHVFNYYKHVLPISLSYQSTGLRVQERASWVGLGWALNAGGVVTRSVKGIPDDHSSGNGFFEKGDFFNSFIPDLTDSADKDIFNQIAEGDYDSDPDVFTVRSPTISGEFAFIDDTLRFRSKQNAIIEYTKSGLYKIASFIITDESGIKYTFAQQENTITTSHNGGTPLPLQSYVSAWYLTKIEHPQITQDVLLEYDTIGYPSTQTTVSVGRRVYAAGNNPYCGTLSDAYFETTATTTNTAIYLKKIKGETPSGQYEVNFTLEARDDLTSEKRLKSIEVVENGLTQKEIEFGYGYFTTGAHKRLKLTSVQTFDNTGTNSLPEHKFEYYEGTIPTYDSKDVDYWGYYNAAGNVNTVPTAYTGGSTGSLIYTSTNSRAPINSQVSLLKKITYPTGGTSSFVYERNDYGFTRTTAESSTQPAGGMRIKSITNYDGVSTANNIVKNISYGMDDGSGLSSGRIEGDPLVVEYGILTNYAGNPSQTCAYYDIKPSSFYSIGHYSSNHLGYKKVTESISSASEFGETVYEFEKSPYRNRGSLTDTRIYKKDGTLKESVHTEKDNAFDGIAFNIGFEVKRSITSIEISPGLSIEDTTFTYNTYSVYESWERVTTETTKNYNGETGFVQTGKTYTYGTSPSPGTHNKLLKKVTETVEGADTRVTNYNYIHETNSTMRNLNMTTQMGDILIEDGSGNDLSKQWVNWYYTTGTPYQVRVWKGSGTAPASANSSNSITVSKVEEYDSYGNPVETKDENGIKSSYDWSTDGRTPIGVFRNADSDDVFAHSFAYDGLDDWTLVDINTDGDTQVAIENNKLKLSNKAIAASGELDHFYYNHGSEITQDVVWEYDVTIANSNSWDLTMNAGGSSWNKHNINSEVAVWSAIIDEQWRVHDGTSWITLKTGLIIGDTYQFKIVMHPGTNKADFYLNGELLNSGVNFRLASSGVQYIAFGNYGYGSVDTDWYIDNVRLYPVDAQAQSAEIDPTLGTTLSLKDLTGATNRFEYDNFGRLITSINPNGFVVNSIGYGYSTTRNTGTFSSSDPNNIEQITYTDPIYETDFTHPTGWTSINSHNVFNIQMAGETTIRMGSSGSYETIIKNVGSTEVIAKIDFYPDNTTEGLPHVILDHNGNRFGIHYLYSSDRFRVQYKKSPSTSYSYPFTFPLEAVPNRWYTIELQKDNDQLTAWVYPKGEGRDPDNIYTLGGFDTAWMPEFKLSGNDNYFYAANLSIAKSSQSTVSYLDGLGREIQTQMRGGTKVIATETLYDKRGLPEIASRPIETTTTVAPGYYSSGLMGGSSFVPTSLGEPLPGTALVHNYYAPIVDIADDEDFAYSQTQYEDSPLARVEKSTLPGVSHQMGSGKEVTTTYGLNTETAITTPAVTGVIGTKTWAKNSLTKTISEDPSGNKTITYTNGWGQTIASGVDMSNDGKLLRHSITNDTTDLVTSFAYDARGNLVLVEDPRGLITTYTYNTLGQLTKKSLPDLENDIDYKYDDKGRLRFVENANHKVSGSSLSHIFNAQDSYFNKTLNPTKTGILFFEVNISPQNAGFDGRIDDAANGYETLVSDFQGNDGGYEITVDKDILVQEGSYRFLGEMTIGSDNLLGLTSGSFEFKPFTYSYTKYDEFDRPIEAGEYYGSTTFASADPGSSTFPTSDNQKLVEYKYDEGITYSNANNTKGKLAEVWSYDPNDLKATPSKTFYSYNNLGLVEWVAKKITGLSGTFFVRYEYDELGRTTQVHFDSPTSGEDHYFWYYYDELGRLEKVSSYGTDTEGSALTEAEYTYYADGQVEQLTLGDGAQVVDYEYTVQGWMERINDGLTSGTDRFGLYLDYLENGNIKQQQWKQSGMGSSTYNYYYGYDKANRLTEACYGSSTCTTMGSFDAKYVYDKSGNLTSIDRYNNSGVNFNDFGFTLTSNTNKLSLIYEDGDDYDVDYDPNGNLIQNGYNGIASANYDWRNLSTWMVANSSALLFNYDGDGNRIKKEVVGGVGQFYIRGADGQTIAVYDDSGNLLFINILAGSQIIGQIEN